MIELKSIEHLLTEADLSINISKNGDAIAVSVLPRMRSDSKITFAPILISGTVDELEAAGAVDKAINEGILKNRDSFVNVNYFTATLQSIEKTSKDKLDKTRKPVTKTAGTGASSSGGLFKEDNTKEEEEDQDDD